jgi:hypothetical protein
LEKASFAYEFFVILLWLCVSLFSYPDVYIQVRKRQSSHWHRALIMCIS